MSPSTTTLDLAGDLTAVADRQARDWKNRLTTKSQSFESVDPATQNGLPAGWVFRFRHPDFHPDTDLVLARCDGGAWVLLSRVHSSRITSVLWAHRTLVGVYGLAVVHQQEAPAEHNFQETAARLAAWVREVLVSLFDPTDADEAAEQVLVAMGGPVTVCPRAAR